MLGVNAGLGRVLTEADDQTPGAHPVAVVSHAWWEQRLGGDPSAVGKTIKIDETTYTIVGVAPKEFFGTTVGSVLPICGCRSRWKNSYHPRIGMDETMKRFQSLYLIGRLKDGVQQSKPSGVINLLFKQSLQATCRCATYR